MGAQELPPENINNPINIAGNLTLRSTGSDLEYPPAPPNTPVTEPITDDPRPSIDQRHVPLIPSVTSGPPVNDADSISSLTSSVDELQIVAHVTSPASVSEADPPEVPPNTPTGHFEDFPFTARNTPTGSMLHDMVELNLDDLYFLLETVSSPHEAGNIVNSTGVMHDGASATTGSSEPSTGHKYTPATTTLRDLYLTGGKLTGTARPKRLPDLGGSVMSPPGLCTILEDDGEGSPERSRPAPVVRSAASSANTAKPSKGAGAKKASGLHGKLERMGRVSANPTENAPPPPATAKKTVPPVKGPTLRTAVRAATRKGHDTPPVLSEQKQEQVHVEISTASTRGPRLSIVTATQSNTSTRAASAIPSPTSTTASPRKARYTKVD